MATNRLYIVNTETKEYVCIAKRFGGGWDLGNVDLLQKLLDEVIEFGDKTILTIGTENNDEFYDTYIKDGENLNVTNKWEYLQSNDE